jgi:hypothetical protein
VTGGSVVAVSVVDGVVVQGVVVVAGPADVFDVARGFGTRYMACFTLPYVACFTPLYDGSFFTTPTPYVVFRFRATALPESTMTMASDIGGGVEDANTFMGVKTPLVCNTRWVGPSLLAFAAVTVFVPVARVACAISGRTGVAMEVAVDFTPVLSTSPSLCSSAKSAEFGATSVKSCDGDAGFLVRGAPSARNNAFALWGRSWTVACAIGL